MLDMPATSTARAYDYIFHKDQTATIRNTIMHYIYPNIKQKSAGVHFPQKSAENARPGHIEKS